MVIKDVLSINGPHTRKIELCTKCYGDGWYFSDLDFGDIPGDEVKINCKICNGTGQVTTLEVVCLAIVPYDFIIK